MSDFDAAVAFFGQGVEGLRDIPQSIQVLLFQLSLRQMTLSTSIGKQTLHSFPAIFRAIANKISVEPVLEVAIEIARRSAKHSAEFLQASEDVADTLHRFETGEVAAKAFDLANSFASRAGGIAADAWASLPKALALLDGHDATRLLERTNDFLERGGGAALHILLSGGEILRRAPQL
jgi:hypothetical protein